MIKKTILCGVLLSGLCLIPQAHAHTALCACMDTGDDSITCEGGFSDGSSAAGIPVVIKDTDGNVLVRSNMDKLSTFVFQKPKGQFTFIFNAGPGHVVKIDSSEISE